MSLHSYDVHLRDVLHPLPSPFSFLEKMRCRCHMPEAWSLLTTAEQSWAVNNVEVTSSCPSPRNIIHSHIFCSAGFRWIKPPCVTLVLESTIFHSYTGNKLHFCLLSTQRKHSQSILTRDWFDVLVTSPFKCWDWTALPKKTFQYCSPQGLSIVSNENISLNSSENYRTAETKPWTLKQLKTHYSLALQF